MNKFEQLTDQFVTFAGGKGGGGKVFWMVLHPLLGEADDIKAGFKDGVTV